MSGAAMDKQVVHTRDEMKRISVGMDTQKPLAGMEHTDILEAK